METPFQIVVVALANILGGAVAIPQAARLIRHRRVEGVSPLWAGSSVGVNAWWIAYGVGAGESSWAIIPVGVISTVAYLLISISLVRFSTRTSQAALYSLVIPAVIGATLPIPAFLLGGWPAVGVTLGTIYGIQLLPAVIAVYRASDLRGVSTATWLMAWTEALLWGMYGFGPRDPGILAFATTGLIMSSAVLAALLYRGRRANDALPVDPNQESTDQIWPLFNEHLH